MSKSPAISPAIANTHAVLFELEFPAKELPTPPQILPEIEQIARSPHR